MELLRRGYNVRVGKNNNNEIASVNHHCLKYPQQPTMTPNMFRFKFFLIKNDLVLFTQDRFH